MFCENCGRGISDDSIFCENCGTKVGDCSGGHEPAYPKAVGNAGDRKGTWLKAVASVSFLAVAALLAVIFMKKNHLGNTGTGDAKADLNAAESVVQEEGVGKESAATDNEAENEQTGGELTDSASTDIAPASDKNGVEAGYDTEGIEGIADLNDEELLNIANSNSTSEVAGILDIDWFYIYTDASETERNRMMEEWVRIDDMPLLLNGGWKAYMTESLYGAEVERYLNISIDTDGDKFNATLNWGYLYDKTSGESIKEEGSDTFTGKWDRATGTAKVQSSFATIEFENFYMKPYHENYGMGRIDWNSGEREYLVLRR